MKAFEILRPTMEYGITLAKSLHPDLILLDVEMPGLTA